MHKEQQGDNKTKEIRIIRNNGIWNVINHEGRTLDATRTRAESEEKCGHTRTVSRVRRALAMMLLKLKCERSKPLAVAQLSRVSIFSDTHRNSGTGLLALKSGCSVLEKLSLPLVRHCRMDLVSVAQIPKDDFRLNLDRKELGS